MLLRFGTYPWLDRLMRQAGRPELGLLVSFAVAPTLAALTASTVGVVLASRLRALRAVRASRGATRR